MGTAKAEVRQEGLDGAWVSPAFDFQLFSDDSEKSIPFCISLSTSAFLKGSYRFISSLVCALAESIGKRERTGASPCLKLPSLHPAADRH